MKNFTPLVMCVGIVVALAGCTNTHHAHKTAEARTTRTRISLLTDNGVVTTAGFAREGQLTIPSQGLTLNAAVVQAGIPAHVAMTSTPPGAVAVEEGSTGSSPLSIEESFVAWDREGVRNVISFPLLLVTRVGFAAVQNGDTIELVTKEVAIARGYVENAGVPREQNLASRFPKADGGNPASDPTMAMLQRTVQGQPTYFLYPNIQKPLAAYDTEKLTALAQRMLVPAGTQLTFLEDNELPFPEVEPPSAVVPAEALPLRKHGRPAVGGPKHRLMADGPIQLPRLAGTLPLRERMR